MARKPTSAEEAEFMRLRAFVGTVVETISPDVLQAAPDFHPVAVADQQWERAPQRTLRGLRVSASDMVEATQDLEGAPLAALELRLASAGAPSLASMRDHRVRDTFQILRRGEIRSDDEWRLMPIRFEAT